MAVARINVDPTDLQPGDVVIALNDHELSGCHCDVVVTVERELTEVLAGAIEQDSPEAAARLRTRIVEDGPPTPGRYVYGGSVIRSIGVDTSFGSRMPRWKRVRVFLFGDPERLVTDPYELLR